VSLVVQVRQRQLDIEQILLNPETIAVNQDNWTVPAARITTPSRDGETWWRPLANGDIAVLVLNRQGVVMRTGFDWNSLPGVTRAGEAVGVRFRVRDLQRRSQQIVCNSVDWMLRPHQTAFVRLTQLGECDTPQPPVTTQKHGMQAQLRAKFDDTDTAPAPATAGLKNVLFVPIDDQRPCYKSYGDGCISPAHDRLAKEGMIFTRAFANFAWCAPSRNSFMSGRRPDRTKAWDFEHHFREPDVGPGWTSLPQRFKDAGSFTTGVGKLFVSFTDFRNFQKCRRQLKRLAALARSIQTCHRRRIPYHGQPPKNTPSRLQSSPTAQTRTRHTGTTTMAHSASTLAAAAITQGKKATNAPSSIRVGHRAQNCSTSATHSSQTWRCRGSLSAPGCTTAKGSHSFWALGI
jgi:hypothetical protein